MARKLFDFGKADTVNDWSPIDDGVMGGMSRSRLRPDPTGHAVFEGIVSLERNGGFASVRAQPGNIAEPGATHYALVVLGDGKRYKLSLRCDDDFDGLSHQISFEPPAGQWATVHLPVAAFRATFRGRNVMGAPPLDPSRARQIGLMIADRQAGTFSLGIRAIRAE
ncbi:CIA30 family protein [Methyloversatilis sp.]|uniref:CIA30 family protein n=1 Tax=Methyloversatilis sp. TaxID=2569862 RepID=UPI0027363221|nr:CIA30 family protein [Methyloversatilis sp.]MDP2868042.1 CIA30 family protein [Methyloversatilis sp.]MDP3289075.1 CIA30 family protein [Methyloversatilis sp.]MDP3456477.1 CIA30 family protein [Methyloversatilis sp.]MDP3576751.1 CIA30 family protein [Methyloversatilis sp.]